MITDCITVQLNNFGPGIRRLPFGQWHRRAAQELRRDDQGRGRLRGQVRLPGGQRGQQGRRREHRLRQVRHRHL